MALTPFRILGYSVVTSSNMSCTTKINPGLFDLTRRSAALRNILLVSSVCPRPKNELLGPDRSGLWVRGNLEPITLNSWLYSGLSKSIQCCSAFDKLVGLISKITRENLFIPYLCIARLINELSNVRLIYPAWK